MINHVSLFVSNLEKNKNFYKLILAPLGYRIVKDGGESVGFGIEDVEGKRDFWIKEKKNLGMAHHLSCIGFQATSKEMVDAFYKAGIEAGGKDNGAPEYCTNYHVGYYAAYVFDPDGNNIEAVYDDLERMK